MLPNRFTGDSGGLMPLLFPAGGLFPPRFPNGCHLRLLVPVFYPNIPNPVF